MKNTRMTRKIIAAVIAFVIIFSAIGCEAQSASGGGTNGEATSFTPTVAPNTSAPDLTSAPTEETTVPNVETTVPDVTTATPETTLTPETTTAPVEDTTAPIEDTTVPDETTAPDVTTEETTAPDITTAPDVTTATPETTVAPETTLTPETTVTPETTAPAPETEAPHVHTPEAVKGTAATCTKDGLTDGVRCATCKATLTAQTKIEAKGHTPETVKGTAATCTKSGLTDGVRCATCKATLTAQTTIEATGHSYTVTKEPNLDPYSADFAADGEKTCTGCGKTAAVRAQAPAIDSEEYARLLANRLLYYINLIRVEEGNLPAQMLPNMTALAEYRAVQLSTNFAHDDDDVSAAVNALKYGEYYEYEESYVDMDIFNATGEIVRVYTGNIVSGYSTGGNVGEAIMRTTNYAVENKTLKYVDYNAKRMAESYHTSEGHWSCIGRDENVFISIGFYVDRENKSVYNCVCASPTDIYG